MARLCKVCTSPDREKIEKALLSGNSLRKISQQTGFSSSALHRHRTNHLPPTLVRSEELKEKARADTLVEEIERLKGEAQRIAKKAEKKGDYRTALAGIRELTRIVELLAKLQGQLYEGKVNVLLNPQWVSLRANILNALEPYPEAKTALVEVLDDAR